MTQERGPIEMAPTRDSPTPAPADDSQAPLPPTAWEYESLVASIEVEQALGQTIQSALDFANWEQGSSLASLGKARQRLTMAIRRQRRLLRQVRDVMDSLRSFPDAPDMAGVYRVSDDQLRIARRSVLLSGKLTAARGASVSHDSLVATLVSIGVCLTQYDGKMRSWRTMFLRHDCDVRSSNPAEEVRAMLDQRARRSKVGPGATGRDDVTRLLRRALQSAAERKALLEKARPGWRIGFGVPTPYALLTGSQSMELIDVVLPILEALFLEERRWVFVPDSLDSLAYLTLAAALEPGELAIFQKAKPTLETIVERGHYEAGYKAKLRRFVDRAGEAMLIGGFRATRFGPPQLFFAHAEQALHAGLIAMADAALQPHRGFPLLLELAGISAKVGLGVEAFQGMVESTYAEAGAAGVCSPQRTVLPATDE
jgi:hypothetical protein